MSPSLSVAWENAAFTPTAGTAYQRAAMMFARPEHAETNANHIERGILQVTLCYPLNVGSAAAGTRAELIRDTFYRGRTFSSGGVTVMVTDSPEIMPGYVDGDRYCVPVRIRHATQIFA